MVCGGGGGVGQCGSHSYILFIITVSQNHSGSLEVGELWLPRWLAVFGALLYSLASAHTQGNESIQWAEGRGHRSLAIVKFISLYSLCYFGGCQRQISGCTMMCDISPNTILGRYAPGFS